MKNFNLILLLAMMSVNILTQNITTTIGTGGLFSIKDTSATFLSLSQLTGNLSVNRNLVLPNTNFSISGIIFKGADRFIHNYGISNTFVGINSGNFTLSGAQNTAVGMSSLFSTTMGIQNTAVGMSSLYSNTNGNYNTALGTLSLYTNTTGNYNTAVGISSLFSNTTGHSNTAVGMSSLASNSTGSQNTVLGISTLQTNTTGSYNTAMGLQSLFSNTTGFSNTGVGINSLNSNTTGYRNTAVGDSSLYSNTTGSNNTAIGYNAQVPDGTLSNQVRIGNTAVTYAGVQVAWTITSDKRWKSDIQNSNLGLSFISKLNPVSYIRKNDESQKTEYGFIAQEVEEVLLESGVDNSGMINIDDDGMYELRYNDLLAPMVKAIQDLNQKCENLESENSELKNEIESLQDMKEKLAKLEQAQLELYKIIKSENDNILKNINISDNK